MAADRFFVCLLVFEPSQSFENLCDASPADAEMAGEFSPRIDCSVVEQGLISKRGFNSLPCGIGLRRL